MRRDGRETGIRCFGSSDAFKVASIWYFHLRPSVPSPSRQVNASCRFSRHAPSCKGFKISLARCTPVKNFPLLSSLPLHLGAEFGYMSCFLFLLHDWVCSDFMLSMLSYSVMPKKGENFVFY